MEKLSRVYTACIMIIFIGNKIFPPAVLAEYTQDEMDFFAELSQPEPVESLSDEDWDSLVYYSKLKHSTYTRQASQSSLFSFATLGSSSESCPYPPNFPTTIPLKSKEFRNWAQNIVISETWVAVPRTYKDILLLSNWAFLNDYTIRAKGYSNSWAPLTVTKDSKCSNTILVDTTQFLVQMKMLSSKGSFRAVQVQTGASIESLLSFLEDHKCALFATPVMGEITIGGALAVSSHGSGIGAYSDGPLPPAGYSSGSLSNLILSFKAIVWDYERNTYVIRKFSRTERDSRVFLTHLGRAFITQVSLIVGPAYKLRCQSWTHLSASKLLAMGSSSENEAEELDDIEEMVMEGDDDYVSEFGPPEESIKTESQTFASLVEKYHSVDLSIFPYTDQTLLMACSNRTKYSPAKAVTAPYPFSYLENVPTTVSILLSQFLSGRHYLAPMISRLNHQFNSVGLRLSNNEDIVGQAKNLLLRYNSKQTFTHSFSSGYAIITSRENIQRVVSLVYAYYKDLVDKFSDNWKYPQNEPLHFTVTGLDDPKHLPPFGRFDPPSLSFLAPVKKKRKKWDVAVLMGINVYPGTKHFDKFMRELESFLFLTFDGESEGLVRPEWSKAWGFTDDGAWNNHILIKKMIPKSFGKEWDWAMKKLNHFDPHEIFTNEFVSYMFQSQHSANITRGTLSPAHSSPAPGLIKNTYSAFLSWAT